MSGAEVLDVGREAIIVMLKIGAPVMAVALIVGLVVSLFQALTQVQEMTLSFVPKILAIFVSLLLFLPFMATTLDSFAHHLIERIVGLG